ncbi:unnamed protein product [Rodentolepis nana]|uniref:VPS13_C domain-containing protein n=1 Tax=Rodentolepis nana TaxID=102285 RepID=A0A0R3TG13_RODNA|nr:unnamed protein product [Rodentolepis nana]
MCGGYLSRQVEPEDLQVKINTLLGEKNLPLVISVAFISEIVAEFPLNFQINDFEIIAQTTSRHFTRQNGDMMSSLISSVTAFAFAAAKVGVEEDLSSDAADFQSIINKFDLFMRLFNRSESENSGLVDYASVAKGGRLIDNLTLLVCYVMSLRYSLGCMFIPLSCIINIYYCYKLAFVDTGNLAGLVC